MSADTTTSPKHKGGWWSLSPLAVFLCLYLITSLLVNDFYKVPITVAFLLSSCYAIAITRGLKLEQRVYQFSVGAGNKNILLMIWIFVLAGAFAQSAKQMGAIDATVNLTLHILPDNLLLAGIFIAACFISLSIGTSVGTIVALTPVAVGLAEKTGIDLPYMVAIVVGGSFFGDNLSFISDTTIASTKTQDCVMRDKFKVNFMIVVPAALIVLGIYIFQGLSLSAAPQIQEIEWIKVIPYLIVLGTAIAGMNVMSVLLLGIFSTGIIGLFTGMGFFDWFGAMGTGITGMGELIIITLLAGGMLETIRYNGGIDFIIARLTRHVTGKRGAELSIAALVSVANLCTANNTIAIITTGPIAKDIAKRFHLDRRKTASILDTFSCLIQGIIPYGAQMLIAAGLAGISPLGIIGNLYYPFCMGACAILAILIRYPRRYS
ncbi:MULTISPECIES: Na+/H+ antiporter NhaC family protein [Bacteroides]|jgi:Na+/H+ antiporter NhaC|uniref:Sodium:proton antiporter n=1 Tax=Bacteroides clarus TaxID=626929 RepID=A0A1Y4JK55_9BACE|nr:MULTISPECIES: Na+/H+ antiporter NhaC family protein [Bacteroides]MCQ1544487.1 Na+/H+ antiporter NhaC family protein [Bacteroides clarus]OKY99208.1 MAG: sodium:proton antiporter [Bacteroides sp. 44_46]OUO00367.1 sodium:proton antiporter [Bacteroides clarus]OUP32883.1 sodium:proton antiporter [Bacteroides clarus]HJG00361.1 Na+/H+ antiporter NhaC family protein [Bacteroides clarus]